MTTLTQRAHAVAALRRSVVACVVLSCLGLGPSVGADDADDIKRFVAELADSDVNVRREAAYQLDQLGPRAAPAVEALRKALSDRDSQVWFLAVSALARVGPPAAPAIPELLDDLDRRGQRSYRSAYALGRIGEAAVPGLLERLEKGGSDEREAAAMALGWVGPAARDAIPGLVARLGDSGSVRRAAAEALGEIGAAAVPALLGSLEKSSREAQLGAAQALGIIGAPAQTAAAPLAALCSSEDAALRAGALAALRHVDTAGEKIVETALARLGDEDADVRDAARVALERSDGELVVPRIVRIVEMGDGMAVAAAADVLATRPREAEKAIPMLLAIVTADAPRADRDAVAAALGRFGPPVVEPLIHALESESLAAPGREGIVASLTSVGATATPALGRALGHASPRVRAAAAEALGRIGAFDEATETALVRVLADDHPTARARAAQALGGIGARTGGARDALLVAAGDAASDVRAAAIAALVTLGLEPKRFLPVLATAIATGDDALRLQAVEALEAMGADAAGAESALVAALADSSVDVREGAASALASFEVRSGEAVPALVRALGDGATDVRVAALAALGAQGANAGGATESIRELLRSTDPAAEDAPLALAAVLALRGIGGAAVAAVPELERALKEGHPKLRAASVRTLARVIEDTDRAVAMLVAALKDDSADVRRETMDALGELGPRAQAAVPHLWEVLGDRYERRIAFEALEKIGPRDVGLLRETLTDDSRYMRSFAARHLGRLGKDAWPALPALRRQMEREYDSRTKGEIREAIEKIPEPPVGHRARDF